MAHQLQMRSVAGDVEDVTGPCRDTPKVVRIRERFLDPHERKRAARQSEAA
jgi:hypothetical protein